MTSVVEQLKLTDYEKIQARLNYCLERLSSLPGEKEESVREKSRLDAEDENLSRLIQENLMEKGKRPGKRSVSPWLLKKSTGWDMWSGASR